MKKVNSKEGIFFSSFFIAFITHCVYFFGGTMSVNEDCFSVYRKGMHAALGRWADDIINKIGIQGYYHVHSWIGIFSILALAVTCTVVISALKVKNTISAWLMMAILITFPTLAYSYGYLLAGVSYSFALMFAAISVWMANKWKYGWLGGAFCLMLSLGFYQAYLAFAATFAIVCILVEMKENELQKKQLLILVLKNLFMGFAGLIFYFIIIRIYNSVYKITLTTYKGINQMGNIQFSDLPQLVLKCYQSFADFLFGRWFYMPKLIVIWNCLLMGILALISLYVVICKTKTGKYLEASLFLGFTVALPIGMCLMDIVAGTDALSIYSVCMIYILLIQYCDGWKGIGSVASKWKDILRIGICTLNLIVAFLFFFITQMYYFKLHVFYQRTYALTDRIVMRIEEMQEYSHNCKVALGGTLRYRADRYGQSNTMFDDIILNDRGVREQFVGMCPGTSEYGLTKFPAFANDFLGTNFEYVSEEEITPVLKSEEYAQMPLWPHKESIQMIDGIIVVKMSDYRWIDVNEKDGKYSFALKMGDEDDVEYVWELLKDGNQIEVQNSEDSIYRVSLEEVGTYTVRVYVKEKETGNYLDFVISERIDIKNR